MADAGQVTMKSNRPLAMLTQFWQQRQERERRLMVLALGLLVLALLWATTVQPAWQLFNRSEQTHLAAEQQLAAMRALQAQAQVLRQQARMDPQQSRSAVVASVKALAGQANSQGANLAVELPAVSATDLAKWLAALGPEMGARPVQAWMQENGPGLWDVRIVVELPRP